MNRSMASSSRYETTPETEQDRQTASRPTREHSMIHFAVCELLQLHGACRLSRHPSISLEMLIFHKHITMCKNLQRSTMFPTKEYGHPLNGAYSSRKRFPENPLQHCDMILDRILVMNQSRDRTAEVCYCVQCLSGLQQYLVTRWR